MRFVIRITLTCLALAVSSFGAFGVWAFLVVPLLVGITISWRRRYFEILLMLLATAGVGVIAVGMRERSPPAVERGRCVNRVRELAMALLHYESRHGRFPPAYVADEHGKPKHSWRVLILPYLDRQDLYDAYDFTEPWDGPGNLRLAEILPFVFRCPSDPSREKTTSYVVVVGAETAWPAPASSSITELSDAQSNTILLVEAARSGIGWTEPRDLTLDEALRGINISQQEGIRSGHGDGVVVAFADGRVRFVRNGLKREALRAMLTRGGATIDLDDPNVYEEVQDATAHSWLDALSGGYASEGYTYGSLAGFLLSGFLLLRMTRPATGVAVAPNAEDGEG